MTLKHTLTALCLAAGLLGAAQAETVLRYSDHEPYGNMRTRFINDVFFCKPCAASTPTSPNSPPNTRKTA